MDCLGNASDTEAAGFTFASDSDHRSVQCPLTPGDTETFGGASRVCHGYVAMSRARRRVGIASVLGNTRLSQTVSAHPREQKRRYSATI